MFVSVVMKMPLDWPRINQFPEWFTVEADKQYSIGDLTGGSKSTCIGEQLHNGIIINLQPHETYRFQVTSEINASFSN